MRTTLLQTLFVLIATAMLAACSTAPTHESLAVPDAINDRGDSVFKIVFLSDSEQSAIEEPQYEYRLEQASKGDFLDFLHGERVRECRKNHEKHCPIYFSGFASAFLAGDNQTLWTVRHAFDPLLDEWVAKARAKHPDAAAVHEALLAVRPKILLYDKYKNLVFDSRKKGDSVRFEFLGDPRFMQEYVFTEFTQATRGDEQRDVSHWPQELREGVAGKLTDIVKLSLSQPIKAPALSFARELPKPGNSVFLLGYPARSQRQGIISSRYYDGHSFIVSPGHSSTAYQMFRQIFEQYKERADSDNKIFRLFEKYFYYHDAPSAEGFSGGPILNENGEVVTLQSSGTEAGGFGLQPAWMAILIHEYTQASDISKKTK